MASVLERFSLAGRTAVVTGAASGLGRAFAETLAAAGAHVACLDRDADGLVETADRIGAAAIGITADLAVEDQVGAAADRVLSWRGGTVDILINNAGLAIPPARLLDVSVEDWDRVMGCNVRSGFLCTRALLPALLRSRHASIVNVSSFIGLVGLYPGFPITAIPYAVSKAAVIGFTRQLAVEYAREHLRVNAIAPGWHSGTRLARERAGTATAADLAQFEKFIVDSVPMGHRGTPDELAGLVLYLASDASAYVTGQVFAHDGGLTAG